MSADNIVCHPPVQRYFVPQNSNLVRHNNMGLHLKNDDVQRSVGDFSSDIRSLLLSEAFFEGYLKQNLQNVFVGPQLSFC